MLSAGNVLSAPHANQGRTRFEGWRRSALRRGTRPHVASTARAVSPSVERGKDDAQATDPTSGERATSNEMESGPEPLHARKALTCGPRAAPEYGARAVHYLPRGAGGGWRGDTASQLETDPFQQRSERANRNWCSRRVAPTKRWKHPSEASFENPVPTVLNRSAGGVRETPYLKKVGAIE